MASRTVARLSPFGDVTGYAYDGLDRPATITYPDASTEAYTYDADSNVLTRTTRKGDTFTFNFTFAFAYDTAAQKVAAMQLALHWPACRWPTC